MLFVCVSCGAVPLGNVLIEYQPRHRGDVRNAEWMRGDTIVVAEASSFPQALAVRIRVVDEDDADYGVAHLSLELYGQAQLRPGDTSSGCYYPRPDEAPLYCIYDFDVIGLGSNMLNVKANAPSSDAVRDCFYYALVDSSTDVDALRASLDTRAEACRGD
jgi:hypothetical protein